MARKNWPIAHIEMYLDGRTHLSFENNTLRTSYISSVIRAKDVIKETVEEGLGDRLQPGRVYRIKIKHLSIFRNTIEFDFDRVR